VFWQASGFRSRTTGYVRLSAKCRPLPRGVALKETATVEDSRRALGAKLAAYRRAAGHSQAQLASLVDYSRSTIANVETGRQHVPRDFWQRADTCCKAGGALVQACDELEAMTRRELEGAARRAEHPLPEVTERVAVGTGGPVVRTGAVWTPGDGDSWRDVIAAAASLARGQAEQAAVTNVGPGTIEQLTAEVARLSRAYVSAPPLPLFAAMGRALDHIHSVLADKAYPAQARDLNFLAGVLCGLMANACLDLGREEAAEDLARAAWTYARIVDHDPLMGWARGTQALAAIWDQRYPDAAQLAEDGLIHISAGIGAARVHAIHARALAGLGDPAQAREAIRAAENAQALAGGDEIHDRIAGEFTFDDAKLRYYESLSLLDSEHPAEAEQAAAAAIKLYQAVPVRARSYGCEALARVQLARAALMADRLEDAADALGSVLVLDPQRRISSLNQHLDACRELLQGPAHLSSAASRRLDQQLAAFSAESTARALPGES
jgi:DNA-binding XRE family transcriptional regulator